MLRSIKEIIGYTLSAKDGEIGHCGDFLFDDQDWAVRYMVADTGKWLSGRKVLISPAALGNSDWEGELFQVNLTRDQIENSPELDEHAPVSRQYEINYYEFFGYGFYWNGPELWGAYTDPGGIVNPVAVDKASLNNLVDKEAHLRSVNEVSGYHIAATDHDIGHVEDFIVDDKDWGIHYMVVDTRNWLPGRKVLVAPQWLQSVNWGERKVYVNLDAETIKHSPEYKPDMPVNSEYETTLYDYYGRPHDRK